ncbi:MAG TPA: metallophosphoesterase family protein [Pirellulales bacterium]|jgi:serine/threonine protein phosphatase 1|nr:metallophosphoesterase family protein [Pirellulales bacterium]
MRLLAIGDIHGCLVAFDALLAAIGPTTDDWLVTLGDYVDRGPDSCGVMERLVELASGGRLIAVRGNHEEMMLDARTDPMIYGQWLQYGGQNTLDSYAQHGFDGTLNGVPAAHWNFLENQCVDWFESPKHFFVHANIDPRRELANQPISVLRWQKFGDPPPHRSGKTMICGHTYQESGYPRNLGHAVCIDTFVYGDGWLTGLDVATGQFWQANQQGHSRTGSLADHLEKPLPQKPR